MAAAATAGAAEANRNKVQQVVVDGLVLLKIMSFNRSTPLYATGPLLGMLSKNGDSLEITNCFPFAPEDDDNMSADEYSISMLRSLREVNVDHLQVGWFQASTPLPFMSEEFITTQRDFQRELPQSVVLVYDSVRSAQGSVALKAYRLSDTFLQIMEDQDFSLERLQDKKAPEKLIFEDALEEVAVVLKTSHLASALLEDLRSDMHQADTFDHLELSTHQYLERQVRSLMDCVDEMSSEIQKYQNHQRNVARQEQLRADAEKRGMLDEEQANLLKPIPPFSCLETLLISSQISRYCQHVSQFASQSFGKLYMAQSLQTQQ